MKWRERDEGAFYLLCSGEVIGALYAIFSGGKIIKGAFYLLCSRGKEMKGL